MLCRLCGERDKGLGGELVLMNVVLSEHGLVCVCGGPGGWRGLRLSSNAVVLYQGEENTRRHEENGKLVLVTERRVLDGGNRQGHIVIKVINIK